MENPILLESERRMKKNIIIIFFALLFNLSLVSSGHSGWIIYNKPEYRGRIIDADTKKPIKGVVVVAVYYKYALVGFPPSLEFFQAQEALTDEKGEFVIPALSSFLNPFFMENQVRFIIYKAGYKSYPGSAINSLEHCGPEFVFSKKLDSMVNFQNDRGGKYSIIGGIVELPPVKTKEKRLRATPSTPTPDIKDTPLLYKAINDERSNFGLKPVGR